MMGMPLLRDILELKNKYQIFLYVKIILAAPSSLFSIILLKVAGSHSAVGDWLKY